MEVSRGTGYGIGLSQVAVTLGVVLFFPPVDVDVYVVDGHINVTTRGIALDTDKGEHGLRVFLAMPLLLSSVLGACFSTITYSVHGEMGLSGQDYQPDVLGQVGMWELCFWVYALVGHAVALLIVSSPVVAFGALSSPCFMVYFLYKVCSPKNGGSITLTQENLNILGYFVGVMQMAYLLTDTRPNGVTVVVVMVFLDYFLGVGHTYDRQATLDTVTNCRLFYVCVGSLSLAFLYAVSGEYDRSLLQSTAE